MHTPPYREQYETYFMQITGKSNKPASSAMLRLYSTLIAIKDTDKVALEEAYSTVCEKFVGYTYALYPLDRQFFNTAFSVVADQYTKLPLVDFLSYVVPDLVCDPQRLMRYQVKAFAKKTLEQPQLVHYILQIKKIYYQVNEKSSRSMKISPKSSSDDVLKKIYACYTEDEKMYPLEMKDFLQFYSAINSYTLDQNELAPYDIGYETKNLAKLLEILFVELQLTRNQAYRIVADFYCRGSQTPNIQQGLEVHNYIIKKNEQYRAGQIQSALQLIAKIPPLEILCAVSTWRKQIKRKDKGAPQAKTSKKEKSAISTNDVTLENSLVYSLFFNSILPESQDQILIAFPSIHFVRKVLRDSRLINHHITFLFDNGHVVDALKYQAGQKSLKPRIGERISFVKYADWKRLGDDTRKYAHILLFGTNLSMLEREERYLELLKTGTNNARFYTLESSHVIGSCPGYLLGNSSISNVRMALIPQGINNSSYPRRKVFLSCSVCNHDQTDSEEKRIDVQITAYTIDETLKTQAISPMKEKPVYISVQPGQNMQLTLRQVYEHEILSRKPPARTRNMSFSAEITPDILVWCSRSYPKGNDERPRLEAYVCEPADEDDENNGTIDRGKAIEATKKHTTKTEDGDVFNWLENEYPYSIVTRRRNTADTKNNTGNTTTNIRDEIIERYSKYLLDKNIALKTFWYLYPNLSDAYSQSAYQMLSEMMQTQIGQQRLWDLTAEECEHLLVNEYPNSSHNNLWKRFEILSTAVDKAVQHGYCAENDLRNALKQMQRSDKLFAQVRRALVKKHFTKAEMQRAYSFCMDKLANAEYGYLGTLIRLMTGLESNIICALRWCDLVYISEYDMYSFVITRQMASAGTITGFHDSEDYICFPIPERLQKTILQCKNTAGRKSETGTIVNDVLPKHNKRDSITPKILNNLTKGMIIAVGIDERKVVLPDENIGSKETDLNKYHGDFIRENFRYWATHCAKLNADELSYLLRTKATTTLGHFYCDFLNNASQLILRVKLNRWETALNGGTLCAPERHTVRVDAAYSSSISASTSCRKNVLLEITPNRNAGITVEVESPYGVQVEMMIMGDSEG